MQEGICDWDWLIGYVDYPAQNWFSPGTLNANPENIYFNIMIKGDSTLSPQMKLILYLRLSFMKMRIQMGIMMQVLKIDMIMKWILIGMVGK